MTTTKFKLTQTGLAILASNITIGGMYYKHHSEGNEKRDRIGDMMIELAKSIVADHYTIGSFHLNHDDHILMLLSVRSALAAFIENTNKEMKSMLCKYDEEIGLATCKANTRKAIASTHLLLDYLECHAPTKVFRYWMEDRKKTTTDMFDSLLTHWEEG